MPTSIAAENECAFNYCMGMNQLIDMCRHNST